MKRNFLRSDDATEYDHTGRLIKSRPKVPKKSFVEQKYFRLRFLEKPRNEWLKVGRDMRWNIYALLFSGACFVIVFGSVVLYENRLLRIHALSGVSRDYLNRQAFEHFLDEDESRFDGSRYDHDMNYFTW